MNFTPAHVHELNNKTRLLAELKEMKRTTREKRKAFWLRRAEKATGPNLGDTQGMDRSEIVDPGANTEAVFKDQLSDSRNEGPITGNDSLVEPILSH